MGSEEKDIIKQFPGKPRGGQFQSLLFSLILQPVRINKPGAPLLGLAKSIYYTTKRLAMLCLSGFELYSRWVPLFRPLNHIVGVEKANGSAGNVSFGFKGKTEINPANLFRFLDGKTTYRALGFKRRFFQRRLLYYNNTQASFNPE